MGKPSESLYQFGPFCLDGLRRTLSRNGERVPMTARTFDVLLALVERPGQTVEKDELLRIVWPDAVVEEANLTQQVFTIRRLLGTAPGDAGYIVTVARRGYRFVAPVARVPARPSDASNRAAPTPFSPVIRLAMPLPADAPLGPRAERVLAASPDGRTIVYVAAGSAGPRLYQRSLDGVDAIAVAATEGAGNPFFSPDGEWIGFTSGKQLLKVPTRGGPPQTICEIQAGEVRGATWLSTGAIVFAPGPAAALWRVSPDGGSPRPFTQLRFEAGERTHRWPHALPDGSGVLFTLGHADAGSFDEASLAVADLADPAHRIVLNHATDGRCWDSRTVMYGRQGALMAAAFEPSRRDVIGASVVVVAGVETSPTGAVHAACSETGVLVHAAGRAQVPAGSLLTLARDGRVLHARPCDDVVEEPRIAHDGRSAIVGRRGRGSDLWLYDRVRQAFRRVTFDGKSFAGIWGPGRDSITCSSSAGGVADLYCLEPDRGLDPRSLLRTEFDKVPGAWSPDGSALVYTEYHPKTGADIWVLIAATGATRPLVHTRYNEFGPTFSPDGRHLAYTSDESGRPEVYVVSLPDASDKCQISTDGGAEPIWSPDGQELFYRVGHRMMHVDVRGGPHRAGVPATLFEHRHVPGALTGLANYDVAADAGAFLIVVEQEAPTTMMLQVTISPPGLPWAGGIARPE
ncbi:MAG: winged helix-turn-helix domain-containing protein [Acidobacteriota bacterium]|nr:winged helix-turn-helix domain-containing protein [Acidobacteriota bacterium]